MNPHTTTQTDSPAPLRAQRRAAAVVSQYIQEQSTRYARALDSPAPVREPWTGCGPAAGAVAQVGVAR